MYSAINYLKPIRQWAIASGRPFFTWKDIRKAMAEYEIFIAIKN